MIGGPCFPLKRAAFAALVTGLTAWLATSPSHAVTIGQYDSFAEPTRLITRLPLIPDEDEATDRRADRVLHLRVPPQSASGGDDIPRVVGASLDGPCPHLIACLRHITEWSRAHPDHPQKLVIVEWEEPPLGRWAKLRYGASTPWPAHVIAAQLRAGLAGARLSTEWSDAPGTIIVLVHAPGFSPRDGLNVRTTSDPEAAAMIDLRAPDAWARALEKRALGARLVLTHAGSARAYSHGDALTLAPSYLLLDRRGAAPLQ